MLRVAVVEDDHLFRLTLAAAISAGGLEVAFHCATPSEAIQKMRSHNIDVFLLDLHLGGGPSGIDLARLLLKFNFNFGIVFLTSFEDPRLLSSNLPDIPAKAQYLVKQNVHDISTLIDAIKLAAQGGVANRDSYASSALSGFSDVQIETLRLVAKGLSNSEIAKQRFVTEKSVEVTIRRVAKALNLKHEASQNQRVHIAKIFFESTGFAKEPH